MFQTKSKAAQTWNKKYLNQGDKSMCVSNKHKDMQMHLQPRSQRLATINTKHTQHDLQPIFILNATVNQHRPAAWLNLRVPVGRSAKSPPNIWQGCKRLHVCGCTRVHVCQSLRSISILLIVCQYVTSGWFNTTTHGHKQVVFKLNTPC